MCQYMIVGMATPQILPLSDLSTCCSLGSGPLSDFEATRYAILFKVLADPARLQILSHLAAEGCEPISVNRLADTTGLSQPTVSHHLKRLTQAGLLRKIRTGRTVTHQIQPQLFAELRTVLQMD